jgi:stage II sporulation protein D
MKIIKKTIVLIIILLGIQQFSYAIYLDIRVYTAGNIDEVEIIIKSGKYQIINTENDLVIADLYKNSTFRCSITNENTILLWKDSELVGTYDELMIKGVGFMNTFEVKPLKPSYETRKYDDNIRIFPKDNHLILVNNVLLEHYIAGVVESEGGGSTRDIDFFIVQAITCRTYALNNIRKHHDDGYHLCDLVHCQAYKGRCTSSTIMMATAQTAGQVIVDNDNKMIAAAFHSNSGGRTMNSEDVWTIPTSYLKSVEDTFSLSGRNATWQKAIEKYKWVSYFAKTYRYPITDSIKLAQILNFEQPQRQVYFVDSIPLKNIRHAFQLKSTYFSVYDRGEFVLLNGSGYGHGVGLSQEGAIRMVELGYSYEEVIKYYYQDVRIINYKDLNYFFINFNN